MKMPHVKYRICNCPKLCEERRQFWVYEDKAECVLDKTLKEAVCIWKENFVLDRPRIDAGELHRMMEDWLKRTPFFAPYDKTRAWVPQFNRDSYTRVVGVSVSSVNAAVYFSRPCPIFYIKSAAKSMGTMKVEYSEYPQCNHIKDFRGKVTIKEIFRELFKEDPVFGFMIEEGYTLHKMVDLIIHIGRVAPKDSPLYPFLRNFKGMLSLGEYHIQKDMLVKFIKKRFSSWRHRT